MVITANDIAGIGTLVLLEGLLSADNALVLALLARRLPHAKDRSRALTLGVTLSFGFRAIGLLLASIVIKFWFLRAAGAAYLIYLAVSHFFAKSGHDAKGCESDDVDDTPTIEMGTTQVRARKGVFYKIVIALALTDLAFAIDSILVAVALTKTMWVIYVGVALGIIALRLVADAFVRLLERYPSLDHTAYGLVAWAGLKLGLEAVHSLGRDVFQQHWHCEMPGLVFWAGMAVITICGVFYSLRHPNPTTKSAKARPVPAPVPASKNSASSIKPIGKATDKRAVSSFKTR